MQTISLPNLGLQLKQKFDSSGKINTSILLFSIFFSFLLLTTNAFADIQVTNEFRITNTSNYVESDPTLGHDGTSYIVVYTRREMTGTGGLGPGEIYAQRINGDGPIGTPIPVAVESSESNVFNDIAGHRIVYTAYTDDGSQIRLYDLENGTTMPITDYISVRKSKISGNYISYVELSMGSTRIMLYDLYLFSSPIQISAPDALSPQFLGMGDMFVVWCEQSNLVAYDLRDNQLIPIANDAEDFPSTSGPWVVWEEDRPGEGICVVAKNMSTNETITVAANSPAFNPTIDGDLIAYESSVSGNYEIYIYQISTGETFQVTNDSVHQKMNNVYGNMVAYVDDRDGTGADDVYVAALDLCYAIGGDTDDDGVCDYEDNCPETANRNQSDADGDGIGDVCDPDGIILKDIKTMGGENSQAFDVNNSGVVVGCSEKEAGGPPKAFLIEPLDNDGNGQPDTWFIDSNSDGANDLMMDIGSAFWTSYAYAINDQRIVTGFYQVDAGDYMQGFVWTASDGLVNIGTIDVSNNTTIAFDINNEGLVVGYTQPSVTNDDPHAKAFLIIPKDIDHDGHPDTWFEDADNNGTNDLMLGLGTLGGTASNAYAISENGMICGESLTTAGQYHLFTIEPEDTDADGVSDTWYRDIDSNGVNDLMSDCGDFDGMRVRPYSINNNGIVHGRMAQGAAFVYNPADGFSFIDGLSESFSSAFETDDQGHVVGYTTDYNNNIAAYLWTQNGMLELEPLTDTSFSMARGIDASGKWIVGWSQTAEGYQHALIWRLFYNTNQGSPVCMTSDSGLQITFDQVDETGITTITSSNDNPGFTLGTDLEVISPFFRVQTTAAFSGNVTLCLTQYAPGIDESTIQLLHCSDDVCGDITTSRNRIGDDVTICGQATSFSWFVVVAPTLITEPSGLEPPLAELVPAGEDILYPDKAFKQGRTLPLKLQLFSRDGLLMTDIDVPVPPAIIDIQREGAAIVMETIDLDSGEANDSGPYFRFSDGLWIYNLGTKNLVVGTYKITIAMPDGRNFEAGFVLR